MNTYSSHLLLIRVVYFLNNAGLARHSTDLSLLLVNIKISVNTKVGTLKKPLITKKRFPKLFFITPKEKKKTNWNLDLE